VSVDVPELAGVVDDLPAGDAQRDARSRRPLVAGALGAAWALLVGLALITFLVMLSWAVSPNPAGNSAAAWRAVGSAWLGAHLVPLEVSGKWITLMPIGGLLLGLLLSRRSGRWAGRLLPDPTGAEVGWCVMGAAAAYGAGGAGVAWLTAGGAASADPRWAAAITAAVAAVGTLWGLAREAGLVHRWRARTSEAAWRTLMAGLAAVVGLFGAGAALVTLGLVRHFQEVAGTLADLDPGVVGAAGLTLLGALSLPNLAVWAMSVLVGPGFEFGRIGGLSAFGGEVDSLPALPVLAAIPASVPAWAPVLMLVPVALGLLAGRVRWGRDLPTPVGTAVSGLGLAGVVAAGVAGLVVLSSGSLGGDRLAGIGPVLVPVTASATGLVLLGFVLEAASQSLRLTWDLHRAERRAAERAGTSPDLADAKAAGGADAVIDVGDSARVAATGGAVTGRAVDAATAAASAVAVVSRTGASAVSVVSAAGSAALARVTRPERGDATAVGDAAAGEVEDAGTDGVVDLRRAADAEIDVRDPLPSPEAALASEAEGLPDDDVDREPVGEADTEPPGAIADADRAEQDEPSRRVDLEDEGQESAVPSPVAVDDDTDEIPIIGGPYTG